MDNLSIAENWQNDLGLVALGVSPKIEFGGQTQARNAAGLLKWSVEVHSPSMGATFRVGVASAAAPRVAMYQPVKFVGLIVGGSSRGLWWHATGIVPGDGAPVPDAPAPTEAGEDQ